MAAAVTTALCAWPPKISGSRAGTITNAASSVLPIRLGIARAGRPRATLVATKAARITASAPAIASRFCHHVQSSWPAPSSSAAKTTPSSGAARLKTSVEAENPSTNIGSPARRNWRSYPAAWSEPVTGADSARFRELGAGYERPAGKRAGDLEKELPRC